MTNKPETLICKHLVVSSVGGDITTNYYEIPFEYDFEKEKAFEYDFTKGE